MDETKLVEYAYGAVLGGAVGVIGFIVKRTLSDVEDIKTSVNRTHHVAEEVAELKRDSAECKVSLANFKAEVAKEYAKEVTLQASLARIHERIDRLPKEIIDLLEHRK